MFPVKSFYKRSSLKNHIRYPADSCSGVSREALLNFRIKLDQETKFSFEN